MRARDGLLIAAALLAAAGGCRKGASPAPDASAPPAEAGTGPVEGAPAAGGPAAEAAPTRVHELQPAVLPMIAVRMGTGASADNGVAAGQDVFKPGEEAVAAVDVSVVPAGAVVKVAWFDERGGGRGEEQKTVAAGARWLTFVAPGSFNWGEGSYRVDVTASTGGNASASFQIVPAPTEATTSEPG